MTRLILSKISEYKNACDRSDHPMIHSLCEHIETDPNCFERVKKNHAKHLAGNVIVFTKDYKKILCLHHKKLGQWTFPGGHTEGDTDIQNTSLKELHEETGILLQKHDLDEDIFHIEQFF